jgi:hypothetical protein
VGRALNVVVVKIYIWKNCALGDIDDKIERFAQLRSNRVAFDLPWGLARLDDGARNPTTARKN